ncbi:hypothetical protein [Shewanella violacea]|uniref:Uncharacterized protein n=1 Tax=Shewanella violacea (strain JCM 10179 / CIP 106290 / LMG 19151 / DSS12) TaxID=637905 RepID=D4ZI20_SHEVD|nr:hypothetical protein [Shewanella violacea]BAJ01319.1 hypothetical protein SVI_1348 [Shewanella violacea DSS12]
MTSEDNLVSLGFKFGKNGAHSARSMMIEELSLLFLSCSENATQVDFEKDIVDFNILHKPTEKSRKLTFRHLVDLYSLDLDVPLFNVLRQWWELDEKAQPVLALQLAVARDPILRGSVPVILGLEAGEHLSRQTVK